MEDATRNDSPVQQKGKLSENQEEADVKQIAAAGSEHEAISYFSLYRCV